jgi:propionyl-CoA carboxylase beta chain
MSSKHIRGDMNFAWPTAEIAVMGARARSTSSQRDAIAAPTMPRRNGAAGRRVRDEFANPYIAARAGMSTTSSAVRDAATAHPALEMLADKRDTNPRRSMATSPSEPPATGVFAQRRRA